MEPFSERYRFITYQEILRAALPNILKGRKVITKAAEADIRKLAENAMVLAKDIGENLDAIEFPE